MAYSQDTETCLHLDRVATFFRLNILNYNDLDISPCIPEDFVDRRCARFAQWNHQTAGLMAIEDIAYYLKIAEDTIQRYLPYSICNGFMTSRIEVPKHYSGQFTPTLFPGMKFITNKKCVSEFGVPIKEHIGNTDTLNRFSTESGMFEPDNYSNMFTATITLPVDFDLDNFKYLYFTHPNSQGAKYRRVPVTVIDFDELTLELTVRGYSHNIVLLEYVFDASYTRHKSIDVCNETIYETELELWVEKVSNCLPYAHLICDDTRIPLIFNILNYDDGIIQYKGLGSLDEDGCLVDTDCPDVTYCVDNCDTLEVMYRSGNFCNCKDFIGCNLGTNTCTLLEKAILTLLADLLPASECQDCSPLLSQIEYWQNDFSMRANNVSYSIPFNLLDNPFGTTRGAVTAWQILQDLQNTNCDKPLAWTNTI